MSAPQSRNPFDEDFAKFAKETLETWKTPGLSIAVVDGHDIFAEGYGYATLPDIPATTETLWYTASLTKSFTAGLLAHLIDRKEFSILSRGWQTPFCSIIPQDFVLADDWLTRHLTLEDAACHRTGMPQQDRASVREWGGKRFGPGDIVRNFRNLIFTAEPRTKFMYSNFMYIALSHAVETITGKPLGDVLKDQIWNDLGMKSTYFSAKNAQDAPAHLATGYAWDEKKETWQAAPPMEVDEISGAGAAISTVGDFALWMRCLIHKVGPLSEKTHEDIRTPRIVGAMPNENYDISMYGLGWRRTAYRGHIMYHHSGGYHAFSAQAYWFPDRQYGVVTMGNTVLQGNAAEEGLAYRLIDDKLGIPQEKRTDATKGWQGAIDMFRRNMTNAVDMVYPNRASSPRPPTLQTSQLTGEFYDTAYGTITLREEPHPTKNGEKILVADRPEMTFRYRLELHHVYADHWIAYDKHLDIPDSLFNDFSAAEFRFGADGKVSSLEITWASHMGPAAPCGTASFVKVS